MESVHPQQAHVEIRLTFRLDLLTTPARNAFAHSFTELGDQWTSDKLLALAQKMFEVEQSDAKPFKAVNLTYGKHPKISLSALSGIEGVGIQVGDHISLSKYPGDPAQLYEVVA